MKLPDGMGGRTLSSSMIQRQSKNKKKRSGKRRLREVNANPLKERNVPKILRANQNLQGDSQKT